MTQQISANNVVVMLAQAIDAFGWSGVVQGLFYLVVAMVLFGLFFGRKD